ncbi:hypothetical protein Sjap_024273 [Stephania japonica]|uniref:Uncharacterized protein n=1 Tax=Stephania japonica TaxID=461633 RepID=A0AAP0HNT3_9MAGN
MCSSALACRSSLTRAFVICSIRASIRFDRFVCSALAVQYASSDLPMPVLSSKRLTTNETEHVHI